MENNIKDKSRKLKNEAQLKNKFYVILKLNKSKYLIDQEINKLLLIAHDKACLILNNSKELVVDCAKILKKTNILKPEDIINIINIKYPTLWELNDLNK